MDDEPLRETTVPDLYAMLIRVRPLEPGTIMPFTGEQVHGALMRWLKGVAPELATDLHEGNRRRLFTVSSLCFPFPKGTFWAERANVHLPLSPEATYTIRITLLRRDLFSHFYQALTQFSRLQTPTQGAAHPPFVQLGKQLFLIEEVLADNDDPSGWCWCKRLSGLIDLAKAEQVSKLALEFASLTTFKRLALEGPPTLSDSFWHQGFSLLPFPSLLFGGLARRWGDIAPPALAGIIAPERLARYIQQGGITVGEYQLTKHQVRFASYTQHGFIGRCAYHLHDPQEEAPASPELTLQQQLHLLALLAFYCGVGYKTTMGLGQARLIPAVHQRALPTQEQETPPGAEADTVEEQEE